MNLLGVNNYLVSCLAASQSDIDIYVEPNVKMVEVKIVAIQQGIVYIAGEQWGVGIVVEGANVRLVDADLKIKDFLPITIVAPANGKISLNLDCNDWSYNASMFLQVSKFDFS